MDTSLEPWDIIWILMLFSERALVAVAVTPIWLFIFSPTIMIMERLCSISAWSTSAFWTSWRRISSSLIGVNSRSRKIIERSSIPVGMCSQPIFRSSRIWRTRLPKPISLFIRYLDMLMLTKPASPAIPTTGRWSLLCLWTICVPGCSGLLVFLITSGILPR